MNKPLQQPTGSTSVLITKDIISKFYNILPSDVLYLKNGEDNIQNYKIAYDNNTKKSFWIGNATGKIISYEVIDNTLSLNTESTNYKLQEAGNANGLVSVEKFGAINNKALDSTSAFVTAYNTKSGIYIPKGEFYTTNYNLLQSYGVGDVYGTYTGDKLYNDNGRRITNPFNNYKQDPLFFNANTRGNFERGAGMSLLMNMPDGRSQISGYNDDSRQSSYINHDAVGLYIGASGPVNQNTVTNCTFTATTCYSTDFTEEMNDSIEPGMFCITTGGTRYSARILGYDSSTKTLTVSGWYAAGNAASGQVPTNGLSVLTNDVSKIWGQNTVVYIREQSNTRTATGYELGFQMSSAAPSTPIWGFHSVNYSTQYFGDRAFYASGKWRVGYHVSGDSLIGYNQDFNADSNTNIGVRIQNLTNASFTGTVLQYNTNYRDNTSKLVDIVSGGVSQWSITTNGVRSAMRERYSIINSDTTLTALSYTTLICTNTSNITINTGNIPTFTVLTVSSIGTGMVTVTNSAGSSVRVLAPKESMILSYDGTFLNVLYSPRSKIATVIAASNVITGSSELITRYRGNVNSTFTFTTDSMVAGQEFKIFNDSTNNNTITIAAVTNITVNTNGCATVMYDGSAIRCTSLYNPS